MLVDEPALIERDQDAWWERVTAAHERSGVGNLVRPEELYLAPEAWRALVANRGGADVEQLGVSDGEMEDIALLSRPTTRFHGSVPGLIEEVKKLSAEGEKVLLSAGSNGELERLADIFNEYGVPYRLGSRAQRPGGGSYADEAGYFGEDLSVTTLVRAFVPHGVALPESKLVIFGSSDLFDESEATVARAPRQRSRTAAFLSDFRDLAVGDYVVHVEHGIGQYQGLREIAQADGSSAEFMILEYAEGARLYIPLTRLDLVQKYRSAEGGRPLLSRLGTQQWAKTKARVKKAMKDMADELLKLYAVRKTAEGHAFPPDTQWMREFEDAFEFNETEDQTSRHCRT